MDKEERIKEIDKEITKVSIIDTPGCILVGIGLYGKFGANGDAFHPLLNDQDVVHSMLALGGAIMAWSIYKLIGLVREKAALAREV